MENLPYTSSREKIAALATALKGGPTIELEVRHHFSEGVYARELIIPKGTVLVGKIHKKENLNIVTKGLLHVVTEEGLKTMQAGDVVVSPRGVQRAGYALEDSVWITVHGTHETDLEKIEAEFVAQDEAEYLAYSKVIEIEGD